MISLAKFAYESSRKIFILNFCLIIFETNFNVEIKCCRVSFKSSLVIIRNSARTWESSDKALGKIVFSELPYPLYYYIPVLYYLRYFSENIQKDIEVIFLFLTMLVNKSFLFSKVFNLLSFFQVTKWRPLCVSPINRKLVRTLSNYVFENLQFKKYETKNSFFTSFIRS